MKNYTETYSKDLKEIQEMFDNAFDSMRSGDLLESKVNLTFTVCGIINLVTKLEGEGDDD